MPWDVSDAEKKDAALGNAIADMTEPMRRATDIIARGIEENFATESAAGEAWQQLAASTIRDRRRKGFNDGPILERTGALKNAATAHRASDASSAEVGPDGVDYAVFHISEEPRTRLPMRDFLAMTDEKVDDIESAILAHLSSAGG